MTFNPEVNRPEHLTPVLRKSVVSPSRGAHSPLTLIRRGFRTLHPAPVGVSFSLALVLTCSNVPTLVPVWRLQSYRAENLIRTRAGPRSEEHTSELQSLRH